VVSSLLGLSIWLMATPECMVCSRLVESVFWQTLPRLLLSVCTAVSVLFEMVVPLPIAVSFAVRLQTQRGN
jgi:hypothetical protein